MSLSDSTVAAAVRAVNRGGQFLRRAGMQGPSLDQGALRRAAQRRTGLEHFGDWPIEQPLERLLSSYHREAHLTMVGRITAREMLVSLLENLLYMEAERAANPSLAERELPAPVFIIGLPRTGTTHLHNLITQDPGVRVPWTWEVMFPARGAGKRGDEAALRAQTDSRLEWANRLAPEFRRIHPMASNLPQECIAITANVFMSIQFHTTHNVATYEDWFEYDRQTLAYDFHHRFLQHLDTSRPGRRWVLKAPGHLFGLDALLARYPNAKIVHTHRDPLRVMASMASHATVLRRAFSDRTNDREIAADWAERWATALELFLARREQAPAAQFLDIAYEDIERAPETTVERVYDFLGWSVTPEAKAAMRAYLGANPKNKHGAHRYSLEQYGLDRSTLLARFRDYCERFSIPVGA